MKLRLTRKKDRGFALLLVMVVLVFLGILAGGLAYSMKVETTLARNSGNETDMEWLGRSGIELAAYVIGQQMTLTPQYDTLEQKWAGGPGGTNDILSSISLENYHLGPGVFTVKITDMESRVNINLANEILIQRALAMMGVGGVDASTIVDSIQDWIDPDDHPHLSGAETDYYMGLNPPYVAKNGLIDDLSELLLIRGITPELYWGSNGGDHPAGASWAASGGAGAGGGLGLRTAPASFSGGLVDLFCAVSGPQVNINTASAAVLQMLPGVDENLASQIIKARSGPDGVEKTEDDIPFHSPGELISVPGMSPLFVQGLTRYCNVHSGTFQVQVDVQINQSKRRYTALLRRNSPRDVPVLNMHWE